MSEKYLKFQQQPFLSPFGVKSIFFWTPFSFYIAIYSNNSYIPSPVLAEHSAYIHPNDFAKADASSFLTNRGISDLLPTTIIAASVTPLSISCYLQYFTSSNVAGLVTSYTIMTADAPL